MLQFTEGSVFDTPLECIVNPTNCEGVIGTSLDREFSDIFPEQYKEWHKTIC